MYAHTHKFIHIDDAASWSGANTHKYIYARCDMADIFCFCFSIIGGCRIMRVSGVHDDI